MIIEELLQWKSSGSGQENRINDLGDPLHWPRDTLYPQKLALTSRTSGGRSVGIVLLRTKGHRVSFKYLEIHSFIVNSLESVLQRKMRRGKMIKYIHAKLKRQSVRSLHEWFFKWITHFEILLWYVIFFEKPVCFFLWQSKFLRIGT
jgi:hypothetical protein